MEKIVEYYSLEERVSSFYVGPGQVMRPSAVLRLLQEAAARQLEQAGLDYETLRGFGMVFLITDVAMRIRRMPRFMETARATTWFCGTRGVRFHRGMRLTVGDELCVELGSHWVLADPQTHRALRPSAFPRPGAMPLMVNDPLPVVPEKLKAGAFDENAPAAPRAVRWSDLDYNEHLNNAVYADIVCDAFPGGFDAAALREMQISFLAEAHAGDCIGVRAARAAAGVYVFDGQVDARACFAARASRG